MIYYSIFHFCSCLYSFNFLNWFILEYETWIQDSSWQSYLTYEWTSFYAITLKKTIYYIYTIHIVYILYILCLYCGIFIYIIHMIYMIHNHPCIYIYVYIYYIIFIYIYILYIYILYIFIILSILYIIYV